MPRLKKVETPEAPVYGVWMVDKYHHPNGTWLIDANDNIIHSDFLGLVKAQAKIAGGKVCIIGDDGRPVELES